MASASVSVETFARLFPFHFAVDADGTICHVGPGLAAIHKSEIVGYPVSSVFSVIEPVGIRLSKDDGFGSGCLMFLRHLATDATLRGHYEPSGSEGTWLFVGSLWIEDPDDVSQLGIDAGHFAPHDPVLALARAVQSQKQTEGNLTRTRDEHQQDQELCRVLALFAEKTDNAIVVTDARGVLVWANQGFERMTGYALAEVIGLKPGALLQGPKTGKATVQYMSEQLARGDSFHTVVRNYRKDGHPYWLELEVQSVRDAENNIVNFVAIQRDITQSRHAEESIRRRDAVLSAMAVLSREFLRRDDWREALATSVKSLGAATDSDGAFALSFRLSTSGDIIGRKASEWVSDPQFSGIHTQDELNWSRFGMAAWFDQLARGESLTVCCKFGDQTNSRVLDLLGVSSLIMVPVFANGHLWGILGFYQVVEDRLWLAAETGALETAARVLGTAINRSEQSHHLRQANAKLESALEGGELSLCVFDPNAGTLEFDSRLASLLGRDEAVVTVDLDEFETWLHPDDMLPFRFAMVELFSRAADRMDHTLRVRRSGGDYRWIRIRGRPRPKITADTSDVVYGTAQDVHDQVRAEQRRNAMVAELREARKRSTEAAGMIQQELLTRCPGSRQGRIGLGVVSIPSRVADGDFFDVITLSDTTVDVVVGDVMGKGLTAALIGAGVKAQISRTLGLLAASGSVPSPAQIMQVVHDLYVDRLMTLECFVTLSYARINVDKNTVELIDCGHTRLLIWSRRTGTCTFRSGEYLPLGIVRGEFYEPERISVEPGDLVVVYSDGVTDLFVGDEQLGEAALARLVEEVAENAPFEPWKAVAARFEALVKTGRMEDDFTLLCVGIPNDPAEARFARIEVPGTLDGIDDVRGFVEQATADSRAELTELDVNLLELAAVEVFTNIVRHAKAGRRAGMVTLEGEDRAGGLELRFCYYGESFTPGEPDLSEEPRMAEGGFGLGVIHRAVDHVEYIQDDRGRMWVTLRKLASSGLQIPLP